MLSSNTPLSARKSFGLNDEMNRMGRGSQVPVLAARETVSKHECNDLRQRANARHTGGADLLLLDTNEFIEPPEKTRGGELHDPHFFTQISVSPVSNFIMSMARTRSSSLIVMYRLCNDFFLSPCPRIASAMAGWTPLRTEFVCQQ